MNTQKIKFDNKEIEVQGCYPYLISQTTGKVVLRIAANETDTTFDNLHALKDNTSGKIEYYERTVNEEGLAGEWELKTVYEDYNSGEVEIAYQGGQYKAEVTRVNGIVKEQAQQRADIDYIAAMSDIPMEYSL